MMPFMKAIWVLLGKIDIHIKLLENTKLTRYLPKSKSETKMQPQKYTHIKYVKQMKESDR